VSVFSPAWRISPSKALCSLNSKDANVRLEKKLKSTDLRCPDLSAMAVPP